MLSSTSSEKRNMPTLNKFASRLKNLLDNPEFRAESRRNKVAIDFSIALVESGMTRQAVADKAGIKLSQLSRQLSGDVNLTLDSMGKICEAMGYEYDLVLRKAKDKPALQPWQKKLNRTNLIKLIFPSPSQSFSSEYFSRKENLTGIDTSAVLNISSSNDEIFDPELNISYY